MFRFWYLTSTDTLLNWTSTWPVVIDGKKTQNTASLWRTRLEKTDPEEQDLERIHHHQARGELEHVLSLDVGDGTVKK